VSAIGVSPHGALPLYLRLFRLPHRPKRAPAPASRRAGSGRGTRASALTAIQSDLQKIKDAQPNLAPERKQQMKDAAAAFATQLRDILKQTVSGLTKTDAQTRAKNAAASLESP
jgi:hypothetical protein